MHSRTTLSRFAIAALSASLVGVATAVTPADVIHQIGTTIPGTTELSFSSSATSFPHYPVMSENGTIAMILRNQAGTSFVIANGVLRTQSGINGVSGFESTFGVNGAGNFAVSPTVNSNDAVAVNGFASNQPTDDLFVALQDGDNVGAFFPGRWFSFGSRPTIDENNNMHWVGGLATSSTASTSSRGLFRRTPTGTVSSIFLSLVPYGTDNWIPASSGASFNYDLSPNGSNHAIQLNLLTGSGGVTTANDKVFAVNGTTVAREGQPIPGQSGLNYGDSFDGPMVNNSGTAAVMASFGTGLRALLIWNGSSVEVPLKAGDDFAGFNLSTGSAAVALNNNGVVAHRWGATFSDSVIFLGGTGAILGSHRVIATGDTIDTDGDGTSDATVTGLLGGITIGPSMHINGSNDVLVMAQLNSGGDPYLAILRFPFHAGDINRDRIVDGNDVNAVLAVFGAEAGSSSWTNPRADQNFDGIVDGNDINLVLGVFGTEY